MRKTMIALMLALVLALPLCLAAAETATQIQAYDYFGRWVDPANDRGLLRVWRSEEMDVPEDEIWYDFGLGWANDVSSVTVWYMSAKFDEASGTFNYTDGVKAVVTYEGEGVISSEETVWEDAVGTLALVDGVLTWTDSREEQAAGMAFERLPKTVPDEEVLLSSYFEPVANMEVGTAGASMKQAELACQLMNFSFEWTLWDCDHEAMQANMLAAWDSMDAEAQAAFDENLMNVIVPMLDEAISDYDANASLYEDAGVGEDMAYLAGDREARDSWLALLGNTLTMGNSED